MRARGSQAVLHWRPRQGDRVRHGGHPVSHGDRGEAQGLGQVERCRDVVHGPCGDSRVGQRVHPVPGRPRGQHPAEPSGQRNAVGHPRRVGRMVRVAGQVQSEDIAQGGELPVVAHGQHEDAVGGRERLVRGDARVGVAHRLRHDPGADECLRLVHQRRERRAEQVDADVLTAAAGVALVQGCEDPHGGVQAGEHVDEGHADLGGLVRRRAGDAHEPAHRLHEQVVPGHRRPGPGAEPRDRRVDHAGVGRRDGFVAQAEARHRPGREVLDEDVGGRGQLQRPGVVRRVAQVQPHRALVAVHRLEVGGGAVGGDWRPPRPGVVAARWTLHLDDLRAEIAEHHRGVRPGQHAAEVGDPQPGQRARGLPAHR